MTKRNEKRNTKRERKGEVVSYKMDKTVKVLVEDLVRHPKYDKVMKKQNHFLARTEMPVEVGDNVVIRETRPYSKTVHWAVVEVIDEK